MEVLGTEFGGMTPLELAAPVNTVEVSFHKTYILFCHDHREAKAKIVASRRKPNHGWKIVVTESFMR